MAKDSGGASVKGGGKNLQNAKEVLLLMLLSLVGIVFASQIDSFLHIFLYLHDEFIKIFGLIIAHDPLGQAVLSLLAMMLIPYLLGLGVDGLFRAVKHQPMPYTKALIWGVWLILSVTVILRG